MSLRQSEFVEVASGLGYPEGPVYLADGSLVAVDVKAGALLHFLPDSANPGKFLPPKSINLGGSPNGCALGPDGALYVCNSGGFSFETVPGLPWTLNIPTIQAPGYAGGEIQRVDLTTGAFETWCGPQSVVPQTNPKVLACGIPALTDPRGLRAPDDLAFDSTGGLWFTDWGKDEGFTRDVTGVYYLPAGSRTPILKIPGRMSPNGIVLSPQEDRLYVAETLSRWIVYWELSSPGTIKCNMRPSGFPLRTLDGSYLLTAKIPGCGQLDSMTMDAEGNIYAATMMPQGLDPMVNGGITVVSPKGEILEFIGFDIGAPEPLPSNMCFGGPDGKTAFMTLAGTGRIVSCRMAIPGLQRKFSNT
ncbi:MAG: SMP-30/gluconolactonase/LRE family protein [Acidobacteriia bacterium]|nr:SMP-30/gluconolactonase/LRE family protein [Terriglobia bacterium]